MSTKIYTGIRFHKATDIFQLHTELVELGNRARERAPELLVETMRSWVKPGETLTYESGAKLIEALEEDYNKNNPKGIRSMIDADLEIVVYPYHGKFYGQYFCDWRPLEKWLLEQDIFEDFAYWNNTDEPEDMNWEEWQFRGQIWDDILERNSVPAEAGLTIKLNDGRRTLWNARWQLKDLIENMETTA